MSAMPRPHNAAIYSSQHLGLPSANLCRGPTQEQGRHTDTHKHNTHTQAHIYAHTHNTQHTHASTHICTHTYTHTHHKGSQDDPLGLGSLMVCVCVCVCLRV